MIDISARIPSQPGQISFDTVQVPVKLTEQVEGRMCAGQFVVTAFGSSCVIGSTETSQPPDVTGTMSPLRIGGLNLCKFNYNFTASFQNEPLMGANDTTTLDPTFDCKLTFAVGNYICTYMYIHIAHFL